MLQNFDRLTITDQTDKMISIYMYMYHPLIEWGYKFIFLKCTMHYFSFKYSIHVPTTRTTDKTFGVIQVTHGLACLTRSCHSLTTLETLTCNTKRKKSIVYIYI